MQINGKELVVGCVVQCHNLLYYKVFGIGRDTIAISVSSNNPWQPELMYCIASIYMRSSIKQIISYPILGKDKNGDDVRLFDMVKERTGTRHKVIGFIKSLKEGESNCFLLEDDGEPEGWTYLYVCNCILIKPTPKIEITVKINGKESKLSDISEETWRRLSNEN